MEPSPAWSESCVCGRRFSSPQNLSTHSRSCKTSHKRMVNAWEKAKATWQSRRRDKASQSPNCPLGDTASGLPSGYPTTLNAVSAIPEVSISVEPDLVSLENWELASDRRRRVTIALPRRFRDVPPEPPAALPPPSHPIPSQVVAKDANQARGVVRKLLHSVCNKFGLFREYRAAQFPGHDPDGDLTRMDLHVTSHLDQNEVFTEESMAREESSDLSGIATPVHQSFFPYPTHNSLLLGDWYWNGTVNKSSADFANLVKIVGHPDFRPEDVAGTNWRKIDADLGRDLVVSTVDEEEDSWTDELAPGWTNHDITIDVPFSARARMKGAVEYVAGNLRHRKLVSVIEEKIIHSFAHLHLEPYKMYWKPHETSAAIRVFNELYSSDAFIAAHDMLQESPPEPSCDLPRVIIGLMFGSDGTHLTDFSTASLSPVYLAFGNESMRRRTSPVCSAFEHVAYFDKLPDSFKSFAADRFGGKGPDSSFMAHCQRDMYQAQWAILLDDEFIAAYEHGMVVKCPDGITRRFYPRIFTYTADYPEKVIVSGIRSNGYCPCPRCLIPLTRADLLGTAQDARERSTLKRVDNKTRRDHIERARNFIYKNNQRVKSANVESLLFNESLVPTINAFTDKLGPLGFDLFGTLVVDIMHEVEIGVWKTIFIHLLRILDCCDESLKYELDRRFREIPAFGRDAIRKITSNRSELKKITAHDMEDMLQCAIPPFEGLLAEPHNSRVLRLLFDLAHWHSLAKLQMHTEPTLNLLSQVKIALGRSLRAFRDTTCSAFETRELERERASRQRRAEKTATSQNKKASTTGTRKVKRLNLNIFKVHSLGDYEEMIRTLGTTPSFTSQHIEFEHCSSKRQVPRTGGKLFSERLSKIYQRRRRIAVLRRHNQHSHLQRDSRDPDLPINNPDVRYNIGKSQNSPVHLPTFINKHRGDPMVKDFYQKLREHLLPRVQLMVKGDRHGLPIVENMDATQADHHTDIDPSAFVIFKKDTIYHHKIVRFHYTQYDVRRNTDIINPGTSRCNIMLLAGTSVTSDDNSDCHPFIYARVLGAYHTNIIYTGPGMTNFQARRLDFLWVRWYEAVQPVRSGWKSRRLDSLCFDSMESDSAYGFVDPNDVLRTCHIIPNFSEGLRYPDGVGISNCAKDGKDYNLYYIGRFSERDLMMRYHRGLAVGHMHLHQDTPTAASTGTGPDVGVIDHHGDMEEDPSQENPDAAVVQNAASFGQYNRAPCDSDSSSTSSRSLNLFDMEEMDRDHVEDDLMDVDENPQSEEEYVGL